MSTSSVISGEFLQTAIPGVHESSQFLLDEQGLSGWKRAAAAVVSCGALLVSACSTVGRSPSPVSTHSLRQSSGEVLFDDTFSGYPGENNHPIIVTGEGSHFSPGPGCPTSANYIMTSGTLIVYKGEAITGIPTLETGDVPCNSITHNDNDDFRLLTEREFGPDISVSADYMPLKDTGSESKRNSFDGFTMWIGNQPNKKDEDYGLYTVSIRNGGEVVIKKKVPESELSKNEIKKLKKTGDIDNGGGYYALSDYIQRPDLATMGKERHIVVNLQKLSNGDAKITLFVDGEEIISAIDNGEQEVPYFTGQDGIRLDYTEAKFDNFKVVKMAALSAARLGKLSVGGQSIPRLSPIVHNAASTSGIFARNLDFTHTA